MSFELIIRLTEIKALLIMIGGAALVVTFILFSVGTVFEKWIAPTILGLSFLFLFLIGIIMPSTETYLASQMAKENPPKTAEETLEIIKKSQLKYHHLRAEQYKGKEQ